MARTHRQAAEAEPLQQPSDVTLADLDPEAPLDLRLKVDATPAHHAMARRVGAGLDQARQLDQLSLRQSRRPTRAGTVAKTLDPLRVVAVNPVPKRLTLHAGGSRRRRPRRPIDYQGQRQQAVRLIGVRGPPRRAAQFLGREVGSRNCHCHIHSPQRISRLRESLRLRGGNRFQSQQFSRLVLDIAVQPACSSGGEELQ